MTASGKIHLPDLRDLRHRTIILVWLTAKRIPGCFLRRRPDGTVEKRNQTGMMKIEKERCSVLVLDGEINSYKKICDNFRKGDYFIFCDAGLKNEKGLVVKADLAVGDFDSYPGPDGVVCVVFPSEKDDTEENTFLKSRRSDFYRRKLSTPPKLY